MKEIPAGLHLAKAAKFGRKTGFTFYRCVQRGIAFANNVHESYNDETKSSGPSADRLGQKLAGKAKAKT